MELDIFLKLVVVMWLLVAPFVLLVIVALGFYIVVALFAMLLLGAPVWAFAPFVMGLPFCLYYAWVLLVLSVKREKLLIEKVGKTHALWGILEEDGAYRHGHPTKFIVKSLIWAGSDDTGPYIEQALNALGWAPGWKDVAGQGITHLGSFLWSEMILFSDQLLTNRLTGFFLVSLLFLAFIRSIRVGAKLLIRAWTLLWVLSTIILFLPSGYLAEGFWLCLRLVVRVTRSPVFGEHSFTRWLYWRLTEFAVRLALSIGAWDANVRAHHSANLSGGSRKTIAIFRQYTLYVVRAISAVGLPEYVRSGFRATHTVRDLQASKDLMKEIGWPVNVDIVDPDLKAIHKESFKEWVLCGTDFATGIFNLKASVDSSLDDLRISGLNYKRSEQYQSIENELESTARYFEDPNYAYPVLSVDDVWPVVRVIFKNSRLTPFNYIISKWEKKYALGFWMKDPTRNKKARRIDFIRSVGYSRFKALWADTFYWAGTMAPVAHVSVKGEPLPERKWAADKVRSIIGSSITQYIMSTVWNYGPNHRFAWDTTPIKIGMPLNGYWMSRIWERHGRFQHHCEGDFTAFDSTLQGPVMDLVKAIRKKGYDFHADRARIATLIDLNYDQVLHQGLGMTSTGNVFRKGTGASTGHSSTSMDNSLSLIILYMMAWKELTGKSGREFLVYNELSCYGDDHFLSFPSVRPMGWTPRNITKIMAKWGVTNNLVVKPLYDMSFLSKLCRRATLADNQLFKSFGLPQRRFVIWHDKTKLVGKMTSPPKSMNPTYRLKRLLSYIDLTAHHKDVYEGIVDVINTSKIFKSLIKSQNLKVPSYHSIMKRWYSASEAPPLEFLDDGDVSVNDGTLLTYGDIGPFDQILTALSMVPDLLNPGVFNFGFVRSLQLRLSPFLSWVVGLYAMSNPVTSVASLRYFLSSGPYRFLDADILGPSETVSSNYTSLLARHWLFCLYSSWRPTTKVVNRFTLLVRKIAQCQFILNATVYSELNSIDLSFDRLFVVALLSFVSLPDWLSPLAAVKLPDFSILVDLAWNRLLVLIWSAVPTNYREVEVLISKLTTGQKPVVIQAPTATGKSTALIASLPAMLSGNFRKVIIVEPRTILVSGLTRYMETDFGISVTGGTSGMPFDPNKTFWYVTPQFMFSHLHLLDSADFFVFDEAHVNEPAYTVMRKLVLKLGYRHVLVTATPSLENVDAGDFLVEVPIARIWTVTTQNNKIPGPNLRDSYSQSVSTYIRGLSRSLRHLVIVDTPEEAIKFSEVLPFASQVLSSQHSPVIDNSVNVYVATSIVDVGITIPGLDFVHSPNWEWTGDGRHALAPSTFMQRKGRVGRTRNGVVVLWETNLKFPMKPEVVDLTPDHWSEVMLAGLPPAFALALDRTRAATALGLDSDQIEERQWAAVMRGASVFLNNFRANLQANAALAGLTEKIGPGVSLRHTGAGNVGTLPSQPNLHTEVLNATIATLRKGLQLPVTVEQLEAVEHLHKLAGTVVPVRDLHSELVNDLSDDKEGIKKRVKGMTKRRGPSIEPSPTDEIYEVWKIFEILKSL